MRKMKRLLLAFILFFMSYGGFANEKHREIEYEAIILLLKNIEKV